MKKGTRRNSFLLGAVVLSAGGFIAKILGAVYRIPLTNMLGSYGMGLYQLVFPMYSLVLTLSGVGFSMAVSKMVAARMEQDPAVRLTKIPGANHSLEVPGDIVASVDALRQVAQLYRAVL